MDITFLGWRFALAFMRTYMYMCAQKKSGCKGTKKNPYIQIYGEKSAEFLNFVRKLDGFEVSILNFPT